VALIGIIDSSLSINKKYKKQILKMDDNNKPDNRDRVFGDTEDFTPSLPEASRQSRKLRNRRILLTGLFGLLVILLISGGSILVTRNEKSASQLNSSSQYPSVDIKLGNINALQQQLGQVSQLEVNGELTVNNGLVLKASAAPSDPQTGQIYIDKQNNSMYIYDGKQFNKVATDQTSVSDLGGARGSVGVGNGLVLANGILSSTVVVPAFSGVLSLQGQQGDLTLTGGSGIAISGTTITNSGVIAVAGVNGSISLGNGLQMLGSALSNSMTITSGSPADISVTQDINGNYTISYTGAGAGGTVALAPALSQVDNTANTSININKTAAGNLVQLAFSGNNKLVVDQNGNLNAGTYNNATISGGSLSGGAVSGGSLNTTAVNGVTTANIVVTTGSYADPVWITSLSKSKVGLGNVENTALSTWAGSANITTLGTITSGTWHGNLITADYGGTGLSSYTVGDLLYASAATTLSTLADVASGQCLMSGGIGLAPVWGSCNGSGSGVNTVGAINSQVKSANGAVISGQTIYMQTADTTNVGLLTAADWNTFSAKQPAGNYLTALSGDGTATGPGSAALTLATVNANIGTFNNVTVNAKGLVTAAANVSYLTAEADTLASVTGRGATTTTALALNGGATIRGLTVDTATNTDDRLVLSVTTGGAARFDGTMTSADLTAARSWTFPDATGTVCLTTGNCLGGSGGVPTGRTLTINGTSYDLSADRTWNVGDMLLGTSQTVTALKTFNKDMFAMKGTSTGVTTLSTANTSVNNYTVTLPAATGTICLDNGNCLGGSGGGVPTTRTLTINGTGYDLTADRSWSVGDMLLGASQTVTALKTFNDSMLAMKASGANIGVTTIANANASANNYTLTLPASSGTLALTSDLHSVVTLGTANGLGLIGQQLSLGTASGTTVGALTAADWNTFSAKQPAGNYLTALSGDGTATGPGSAALTLATVNANIGAFNNVTVNAKGLVTAASNVSYLTAEADPVWVAAESGYAKLAGRAGGQVLNGGTVANNTLTLQGNGTTGNTATNASLLFKVGDSAGTTAMTILNNGDVGIGSSAPTYRLEVKSGSYGFAFDAANQRIGTTLGTGGAIAMYAEGPGSATGARIWLGGSARDDWGKNASIFFAGSTEVMRIDGNYTGHTLGNIGMGGVTSPTAILQLGAPTTGVASLRLTASTAIDPSAPNIGDLWFNGTNLYFRKDGSTSQDLLVSSCSSCLYQVPATTAQNTITPTVNSVVALTVNGTSGTATTAMILNQSGAADGINLNLTNTSGTQTNGMLINRNGAGGTTTSLLNLTNTAGTATNALTFTGTFTNLLNSTNFTVTNAGAVTAGGNYTFMTGANRTISIEAQTSMNSSGNSLTVQAATGNGAGHGGGLILQGGSGSGVSTSNGGAVSINGGVGGGVGGAVNITAGNGGSSSGGGNLTLQAGNGGASIGTAGATSIYGGSGGSGSSSGGGNLTLQAGTGGTANGNGGATYLYGGNAGATNANGGNVVISAGTKAGTGTSGTVIIKPQASNDSTTAFQVQNAAGTSIIFNVDTTNSRIGINTVATNPIANLQVVGTSSSTYGFLASAIAGSELITAVANRDFSAAGNWSGTGWTVSGGVYTHTAGANSATLNYTNFTTNSVIGGHIYKLTFTVSGIGGASPTLTPQFGNNGTAVTANGTYTQYLVASSSGNSLVFSPNSTFTGSLDNISLVDASVALAITNNNGRVSIGTTSASYDLSFGPDTNRTIGVEQAQHGNGNNLTVSAGNGIATSDTSNGGALNLYGGNGGHYTGSLIDSYANGGGVAIAGGTGSTGGNITIAAGAGITGDNDGTPIPSTGGNITLAAGSGDTPGSVIVKNPANSTTAFQVQNAAGTGIVINANTTNKYVGINTAAPSSALHVIGTSSIAVVSGSNSLTADGTFATSTGWTVGANWAIASGVATHTAGSTATLDGTSTATSTSIVYQINFTISGRTAGSINISLGGTDSGTAFTATGTAYVKPGASTGTLSIIPTSTFDGSIDNVTIYAIAPSSSDVKVESSNGASTSLQFRAGGSGLWNVFIGNGAGENNLTGYDNFGLGYNSLNQLTTGYDNIAIGVNALQYNTVGNRNVAIGLNALRYSTALNNIAIGDSALGLNTTGNGNTVIGVYASDASTTGYYNTALGQSALGALTTGSTNTSIGYGSGGAQTTASGNVFLGAYAGQYETGGSKLFIDNQDRTDEATARTSSLLYGQFDPTVANQQLTVNGKLYLRNLSTGTGTVLCQNTGTFEVLLSATSACSNPSSIKLKENITNLSSGEILDKLGQIRPVSFDWKASSGMMGYDGTPHDYGMIAEEVNSIFPHLVASDENGQVTGLGYIGFVPLIIAAIQEQQTQITNIQTNKLDLTGGTINGTLNIVGGLNATGPTTIDSLTVTTDALIKGNLTVQGNLSVNNLTVNGHIITAGNTPTAISGLAAGTGATVQIQGNDTAGTITITTGPGAVSGSLVEVTFAQAYGKAPKVVLTPGNADTTNLKFYRDSWGDKFTISTGTPPTATTTYVFDYFIAE